MPSPDPDKVGEKTDTDATAYAGHRGNLVMQTRMDQQVSHGKPDKKGGGVGQMELTESDPAVSARAKHPVFIREEAQNRAKLSRYQGGGKYRNAKTLNQKSHQHRVYKKKKGPDQ